MRLYSICSPADDCTVARAHVHLHPVDELVAVGRPGVARVPQALPCHRVYGGANYVCCRLVSWPAFPAGTMANIGAGLTARILKI